MPEDLSGAIHHGTEAREEGTYTTVTFICSAVPDCQRSVSVVTQHPALWTLPEQEKFTLRPTETIWQKRLNLENNKALL